MHGSALTAELRQRITFPDGHADVWPLFYDPVLFNRVVDALAAPLRHDVSKIAGIEARGFLLGAAVAARLGVGFVAIRKQGGLYPGPKLTAQAEVDYRGQQNTCVCSVQHAGPATPSHSWTIGFRPPARRWPRSRLLRSQGLVTSAPA